MAEVGADKKKEFDPADYPALRDFLAAYLHQDFAEEYGSAPVAVNGFVSEANGDEILQVQEEWKRFRADFAGQSLQETQSALENLGSAWQPQSEDELREVDKVLAGAKT